MPTAVNDVEIKGIGYGKIVAHATRKFPNDNNKVHIDENLTKYNQTFHVTNFEKQLLKNVDGVWIKEHDAKAAARHHYEELYKTKKNFIDDQKKKGLIQDKRGVAMVGDHVYYEEVLERVSKLHPEWSSDEVTENVLGTYNKAFRGFAKGFNQTHDHLVISRCDTNVDERPPHMHYQLTGLTKTAKGKPSFSFGKALHATYSPGKKVHKGDDYKSFREDADSILIKHFKKAMVADYGKSFNDIKLIRTGGVSGLSQEEREHLNNQVEMATKTRREELDARETKLDKRESKIKDREDFNWRLTRENNNLKHDTENAKKEIEHAKSDFALTMFNSVQDVQRTYYHAYDWVFDSDKDTHSLTPENSLYEDIPSVQEAEPDELSPSLQRQKMAFDNVTELREIIDDDNRKKGDKGVSLFSRIAKWGKDKIETVKTGFDFYRDSREDELNEQADENRVVAQGNARTARNLSLDRKELDSERESFNDSRKRLKNALVDVFKFTGGVKRLFPDNPNTFDKGLEMDWPAYSKINPDGSRTDTGLDELVVNNLESYKDDLQQATLDRLTEMRNDQLKQAQAKKHKKQKEDEGPDL